jgi:4-hydroxy-3-methylbut-2-en-1-yl diphosphate reductase
MTAARSPTRAPTRSMPVLVCAPMRLEVLALQPRLPPGAVRRTGYGRRSLSWALAAAESGAVAGAQALAIAGVGMGVVSALRPGDVVVATDVVDLTRPGALPVACTSPEVLVDALRRAGSGVRSGGFAVHAGRVATAGRLVGAEAARRLEADGVLAADLESAYLAPLAGDRPLAVVRVVVDTPARPLTRPDVVLRGSVVLTRLGAVGSALARWASALATSLEAPKETRR